MARKVVVPFVSALALVLFFANTTASADSIDRELAKARSKRCGMSRVKEKHFQVRYTQTTAIRKFETQTSLLLHGGLFVFRWGGGFFIKRVVCDKGSMI